LAGTLAIRQATQDDYAAVEALAALSGTNNPGHEVITGWQPAGEFYVAVGGSTSVGKTAGDGTLVGAVRLARFGDDEWWLEPPVVQPDHPDSLAVARALVHHAVRQAELSGRGLLRFAANAENKPVHKLAAEAHFSLVGRYAVYQASVLSNSLAEFTLVRDGKTVEAVQAFLDSSPHFAHAERSIEESSTWSFLTAERLRARIADSLVYAWRGLNPVGGVIILDARYRQDKDALNIAYLDAAVGSLAVMAQAARSLGALLGYPKVQHRLLARPERLVAIEQAGWRPPNENGGEHYLFSRPLDISQERYVDP
jgi:hypothetical protein